MLPKITIITPSFNQADFLEETLQSIHSQEYPHLEHLIIDGDSQDNSVAIIKKYESKLTYWESQKDRGQTHAINKGLQRATGDIITWINSDDILLPNTLITVAQYFQNNPYVFAIHGKSILYGHTVKTREYEADTNGLQYNYLGGLPFAQPSSYFRRQVIEEKGLLDENYQYGMDYELFAHIALNHDILQVPEVLSKYRFHETAKTVQGSRRFSQDYAKIFSKILRSFDYTKPLIDEMKLLNLYVEGTDSYHIGKEFSLEFLQKAFLYHLKYHVIFLYEVLDLKTTYLLTDYIHQKDEDFWEDYPELAEVHFRSQWLPAFLIKLLRKITR